MDTNGTIIVSPQFEAISYFNKFGVCSVSFSDGENERWALMNESGELITEPIFDLEVHFDEAGIGHTSVGEKNICIDTTGNPISKKSYDYIGYFSKAGLAPVRIGTYDSGKWGYINKNGKEVVPTEFDRTDAFYYDSELAPVCINDKWGYVDKNGEYVVIPQFDSAGTFANNGEYTEFSVSGKYGIIDKNGNIVVSPKYDNIYSINEDGIAYAILHSDPVYVYIDGREFLPDESEKEFVGGKSVLELPFDENIELFFSSGAGAWGTALTLSSDGSFEGEYHDSDAGSIGEGYPNGTVYICNFSGSFEDFKKVDENIYSLNLAYLSVENEEDEVWIENGIRYVASGPHGIEGSEEFLFYTPNTDIKKIPEEVLTWNYSYLSGDITKTLNCFGLHNVNEATAFFS